MEPLKFQIEWIEKSTSLDDVFVQSRASLVIEALVKTVNGREKISLTEIAENVSNTTRKNIIVPTYPLAKWLLLNWWKIRWEPTRSTFDWRQSHEMASVGEGIPWPPIVFSSDGEFIQVELLPEPTFDAADIRYINGYVRFFVHASLFEAAIDRFLKEVLSHLSDCKDPDSYLGDLWNELNIERADPKRYQRNRLEALAGLYPGSASEEWIHEVSELKKRFGAAPIDEAIATLDDPKSELSKARDEIDHLKRTNSIVDLSWVESGEQALHDINNRWEIPWQKGERLARHLRKKLGIFGPVDSKKFGELLHTSFPIEPNPLTLIDGGFREEKDEVHFSLSSKVEANQRFYMARLAASSLLLSPQDSLLPVTETYTALQKAGRAFAREFLCPWDELNEYTNKNGIGETGIEKAAAYFNVSEWVIDRTLQNKGKLKRKESTYDEVD